MSGGARESWSSVTSRFQSDSPLSLRAELLERTSKIHSSGARERENYPLLLLRRRSRGEIFQISPPPSSSSRNNDAISKQISLSRRAGDSGEAREGGAVFPGSDSSEAASEVGLGPCFGVDGGGGEDGGPPGEQMKGGQQREGGMGGAEGGKRCNNERPVGRSPALSSLRGDDCTPLTSLRVSDSAR